MPNFTNHRIIPEPPGALQIGPWRLDGGKSRSFTGTRRTVLTGAEYSIPVDIRGDQTRDGRVSRLIWVSGVTVVTAAEAREMAACLLAAARELDELSDVDWQQTGADL